MKRTILLALFACATAASTEPAEPITEFTRTYSQAYAALNMGPLELSYHLVEQFKALGRFRVTYRPR
jgi:hypothetical protein